MLQSLFLSILRSFLRFKLLGCSGHADMNGDSDGSKSLMSTPSSSTSKARPASTLWRDPHQTRPYRQSPVTRYQQKKISQSERYSPNGDRSVDDERPKKSKPKPKPMLPTRSSIYAPVAQTSPACSKTSIPQPQIVQCRGIHSQMFGQQLK